MTQTRPQPTLLVFTLGAQVESRRRRLVPERWRGAEVEMRRACFGAVLSAGREAGCALEVSCPHPPDLGPEIHVSSQGPGTFGTRLSSAFSACLERSQGPVVVVGTDVPGLTSRQVRQALERLADDPDRVVIGPSPDGGFYLLAASRPIEGLSSAVSWCRGSTLTTLLRALQEAGRAVELLEPLADLDSPADLERWLAQRGDAPASLLALVEPLRRLLAARRRPPADAGPAHPRSGFAFAPTARGPPPLSAC